MSDPDLTDLEARYAAALAWAGERTGRAWRAVERLAGGRTSAILALTDEAGDECVLRMVTEEPWRTHGARLTTRERDVQRLLADSSVPAPRSLALDSSGAHCGHPAHLMTRVPGVYDVTRVDDSSLDALALVLRDIHAIRPAKWPRTYQSWAWPAKHVIPDWATEPVAWAAAYDLLREERPAYEPVFIHRDFGPNNVLWAGDSIGGVVDWVETSTGPAALDLAHCRTNLAFRHSPEVADRFLAAYGDRADAPPDQRYWDVLDIVGFLPPPGGRFFLADPAHRLGLERHLVAVLG